MRKMMSFFVIMVLLLLLLPAIVTIGFRGVSDEKESKSVLDFAEGVDLPFKISVYDINTNQVFDIEFEEYICGVVAGEMPPTNNVEALKAQAVAARSFILSKAGESSGGDEQRHKGAMICTDSVHCKEWQSINDIKKVWDTRYADEYEERIRKAVSGTWGEYMVYEGETVKAYFYAMSGGRTENASEVWGAGLPYLKSVNSREDLKSDGFETMYTVPREKFCELLKKERADIKLSDGGELGIEIKRTEGGGVSEIKIAGVTFNGEEIRKMFNLKSTNFEIKPTENKVTFVVKGNGHGVGMSQNGANVLAGEGKKYDEILKHYYSGVSIVNLYKKR